MLGQDEARQLYWESALTAARNGVEGCDEIFKAIQKETDKNLDNQGKRKRLNTILR